MLIKKRFLSTACALLGIAFLVLVTKVFYPWHRPLAFAVYAGSWISFLLSFRGKRNLFQKHRSRVRAVLPHVLVAMLLAGFAYVARVLVPVEMSPLTQMNDATLSHHLQRDLDALAYFRDLQISEWEDENELVEFIWPEYCRVSLELDLIKTKYKGFYQIDYLTQPKPHSLSFLAGYGAFIIQYVYALHFYDRIGDDSVLNVRLNEANPDHDVPDRYYGRIKQMCTHPDQLLRLNAGRAYMHFVQEHLEEHEEFVRWLEDQYASIQTMLGRHAELFVENPLELLEQKAFTSWFPIQKEASLRMSYVRLKDREYFITPELLEKYHDLFQPGDILLERRNWHMTNIGIPGFWPHAALYVGPFHQIDTHFATLRDELGQAPTAALRELRPEAVDAWMQKDAQDFPNVVIESKRPGVMFTSLEQSANCDHLAVLRPRLSLEATWRALTTALTHYGKPYDYNFDFSTDGAIVCSELIYKCFQEHKGWSVEPEWINGRLLLPPNGLARHFDRAYGTPKQNFDLVLFLDGIEKQKTSIERGEDAFRSSWQRPKWYVVAQ